jgi:hypothetical protein
MSEVSIWDALNELWISLGLCTAETWALNIADRNGSPRHLESSIHLQLENGMLNQKRRGVY